MKLSIEKLPHGDVRVQVDPGGASTLGVTLTPQQVDLVVSLLQTAKRSETFRFVVDLP